MSKSLKNFITVRDLLDQGVSGIVIRYLLLSTHYRKPFDFTQKALDDATKSVEKFYSALASSEKGGGCQQSWQTEDLTSPTPNTNHPSSTSAKATADATLFYKEGLARQVLEYLADDLNISKAIAALHEAVKEINANNDPQLKKEFIASLDLLGLLDVNFFNKKEIVEEDVLVTEQIELRLKAKQEKNFAKADEIRNSLLAQGVVLEDVAGGKTIWKKSK